MPICRYEIRNEFSLADPDLYRAADKDDPEALLEGVAMAGLVGVLRQLGDLAELAAEIFRDLHEEVLATAARGHGLTIRVQQLEAEVPSVEKAFLSQTNHSPFFNNAGVDWHPNLRMSENLVTQGDLPRFVMDSYEECRGPPRLFLLDKFDVAGAGACLKRYTDPSLYKVEMSAMIDSDVHRGRKIRKAKKKGARGRNGETPEVQPLSQANLHQFLLEESVENGVSKPARRVKLKRRPQYSPFDSKTGRSYMENFLKSSSPEHQMLREITEVPRPRSSNPSRHHVETKGILPPASEQNMQKFLKFETDEVAVYEAYNNVTDCVPSTFNEETGEKDIAVDGQGKTEGYLTSYQSDEFASEMDNFVDAPSTMDSEMDTDSELRVNKDFASSSIDSQQAEKQVGHLYSLSSDSRYTGDSISDDTNSSSKKEVSSFLSSDSPISSANKNLHSQEIFADGNAPAEVPETTVVDEAVAQKSFDEVQVDPLSKQGSFDDAIVEKDSVTNDRPDFEQQLPKLDETVSTMDDEEKKINMLMDVPCSPSFSGANSQPEIGSPQSSYGEHLVDEPNSDSEPLTSSVSDAAYHTTGDSAPIPDCLLREGEYDHKDLSQFENTQSMLNTSNDISQSVVNEKINNIENPLPGKMDDEAPKLTEIFPSDDTDTNHTRDSISSKLSEVEKLNDKLDNEDSNVISDASNHSLGIMETSLGKELTETSLTKDEIVDTKDHYSDSSIGNQIISETLILSSTKNSPDWEEEEAVLDAHYKDFIPMEETTANETPTFGNPESFEVSEPHEMGLSDSFTLTPNDVVGPGNLSYVPEYLGDSTITTGVVANEEIDPDKDVIGLEVREISSYEDTKSPSEVHNLLDESYSKTDQSDSGVMASPVSSDSDNAIAEDVIASLDHGNMADKYINCSSMVESEDASGYLSITRTELGLMEEVFAGEASTSDLSCSTVYYYDHPKLEVTHAVPHLYVNSSGKPTEAQSPNEHKRGVDMDQELSKKSGIENQVSDVICFSIKRDAEETVSEKIEIPPANQIDEELPYFGERISESSQNFSTDAPGYPKYPLGFIFPSGNTLAEINQINLDELPPLPPLPPVEWRTGRLQHALSTTESEMMKPAELLPQEISSCATSIGNVNSSVEERNHTLFPNVSEKISKEEKIEQVSSVHETIDLPPKIENEKQQERFVPLPLNSEDASPAEEDEVASKSRMVKPPRPPNPLIESIAVLDKSKLRKVAERVRPEIQKMDERDSLLEQIRAKSFNLKPAVVSRPSVKGPQTNLKVAAILEKANAIRQAFAGSDEDDEDNWSDS